MFLSIYPIGSLAGPILGGVILEYSSWHWMFLINVPVGLLFTVSAIFLLPRSSRRDSESDVGGALLFGCTLAALMLGITALGSPGVSPLRPIGFGLVGVALLSVFLVRNSRRRAPLIATYLLTSRVFATMNFVNLFYGASAIAYGSLVPLYAQERYGFGALEAGSLLTAAALGALVASLSVSMLLKRLGYRKPMYAGFVMLAVGLVMLAVSPVGGLGAYPWLMVGCALAGFGTGTAGPASNNALLDLAPTDVASVSGLRGTLRLSGSMLAISATTAVVAVSSNEGTTLASAFLVLGLIPFVLMPLIRKIPERRVVAAPPSEGV